MSVHAATLLLLSGVAAVPDQPPPAEVTAAPETPDAEAQQGEGSAIVVTARRREEALQDVPIAIAVVDAAQIENTGSFNIGRLQQLQPTLQFYSSNPRNSAINIRGIGAPLGLTNDGIEQGVGIYIDQVYYNRVAAGTLDFVDIDRIEVLRGPQGTLYGKNTTAGAISITTKPPSFDFEGKAELSVGNYNFKQAKASISGPLAENVAARFGVTASSRRGTIWNTATNSWVQSQDNVGLRGTVLWKPTDTLDLFLSGDYNLQDPVCCVQIYSRLGSTQRPATRQFTQLAAAFGYAPPSTNPFDRVTDLDSELRARNEHGGVSLRGELDLGAGTLTSVTAFRYWDWKPSNDRDFTGLPINLKVNNPTKQRQYTQELRYAQDGQGYNFVVGAFGFYQDIHTTGIQQQGPAASRWLINPSNALSNDPSVLNGLTANNDIRLKNFSGALFGKLDWDVTDQLTISPGIRLNYDDKVGSYVSVVTDGNGALVPATGGTPRQAAQRDVLQPQEFRDESYSAWNLSYDLTLSYKLTPDALLYATYARAFKSGGLNLNGVPVVGGVVQTQLAQVAPEKVNHFEVGLKTELFDKRATFNLTGFWTEIKDYQAVVNNGSTSTLRGYLANAGKVRVRGIEAEFAARPTDRFSVYANGAFTDHEYVDFKNAPCPPELSGGGSGAVIGAPGAPGTNSPTVCDISGQWLPGVSRWAASYGAEYNAPATIFGQSGQVYVGGDASYRSKFSSNASRSAYTDIDGYSLANFRLGFRSEEGFNLFGWVRNAFDEEYFEQLATTPGNTGLIAGQPGDPRTYGATLSLSF